LIFPVEHGIYRAGIRLPRNVPFSQVRLIQFQIWMRLGFQAQWGISERGTTIVSSGSFDGYEKSGTDSLGNPGALCREVARAKAFNRRERKGKAAKVAKKFKLLPLKIGTR
jgi:hypothetical protein